MRPYMLFSAFTLCVVALTPSVPARAGSAEDQAAAQCDLLAAAVDDITKPAGVNGLEVSGMDGVAAVGFCEKATTAFPDNARYIFQLGRSYFAAEQYDKSFPLFEKAALAGHVIAMNHAGFSFDKGFGVAKDAVKSTAWYQKASEAGSVRAQRNLGISYMDGVGTAKDYGKAMQWFMKSAEQGYAPAMVYVGILHEDGWGVPKNESEAFKWYAKAAEQDDIDGINNMALLLDEGRGVAKDEKRAFALLERASKRGHAAATSTLGWFYERGVGGVLKDVSKANELYLRGADGGDSYGMNNYGENLIAGEGVSKNVDEGVVWLIRALEADSEVAAFTLGNMRAKGENMAADPAKAADLFVKALEGLSDEAEESFIAKKGEGYSAEVLNALQDALIKRGGTFAKSDGKLGDGAIAYMQSILAGN